MTLIQDLLSDSKLGQQELARQDFIVSVTEQIWAALEEASMTKADLARALEKSKSHITQLLGGQRNMTLATLADIGTAIGVRPHVVLMQEQHQPVVRTAEMHPHWSTAAATTFTCPPRSYATATKITPMASIIRQNQLFEMGSA